METMFAFADTKTVLTRANAAKTATLATAPFLLSVLTDGRFVPLALLTTLIGLALVSIRKSAAEGNRSTTENIVIGSMLVFAATVWGYFVAGALFFLVPVLAVVVTRGTAKKLHIASAAAKRAFVSH